MNRRDSRGRPGGGHPVEAAAVRRRSFLAGAASLAAAPALGAARRALEPRATVGLPGAKEAVVDDSGTTAYVAVGDGFAVVDVSDPATPAVRHEERGTTFDGGKRRSRVWDAKVSGDRLVTAGPAHAVEEGEFAGFVVYDVSNPASPRRVAVQRTDHAIHNCFLDGDTLYVTGSGLRRQPLVAWDVSTNPPSKLGSWSVFDVPGWSSVPRSVMTVHDVYVRGDAAYVAYWDVGTWILDVSDPANPTPTARLAGWTPDEIPADPGFLKTLELPGNSHHARPSPDGSLLAVNREATDNERTERDGGPGGISIWDLSATPPAYVTTLAPPTVEGAGGESMTDTAHNFGWRDRRLYASWYTAGVRVYDLSAPTDPRVVGSWADPASTSFWTAQPMRDGFVATSALDPGNPEAKRRRGAGAALYTFPEPTGERPAATVDRGFTAETVDVPHPTTTTTTDIATSTMTTSGGQAGFTALAALGAGGVAAWRRIRERDGE